jgi:H+/Cl- antiporter ClcA
VSDGEDAPLAQGGSRASRLATYALGGLLGGVVGGFFVVAVTLGLKAGMDNVSGHKTPWVLVVAPLFGLLVGVLGLQRLGDPDAAAGSPPIGPRRASPLALLRRRAVSADISGDVVAAAGQEERFPWRQVPVRVVAVFATVGMGAAMGTEAPAAYFGVAAGAWLGERGRGWRRLLRPAALGGGAAGVAALMGIPLVGTGYMLEMGRRNAAPLSAERVTAALVGGLVGWAINISFHLNLIRLVVPSVPTVPPVDWRQAVVTALFIGALSGALTSLSGWTIYRAKKWETSAGVRLLVGGLALACAAVALMRIAGPSAAVGPGGGAIVWAENNYALPGTLLAVAVLRALATTATAAAGGCGGIFVPFLAVGDIGGRVFAPGLGIGPDLAGSAGAAAGIAGGYRLPFTAAAMVLGVGGPYKAVLVGLATVVVGFFAGVAVDRALGWLGRLRAVRGRRLRSV